MLQIRKLSIVALCMVIVSMTFADNQPNTEQFLAKPTGQYGVGFRDFHFQDGNRCPDLYATKPFGLHPDQIAHNYSADNPEHCREIMVRVYYPINGPVAIGKTPYYSPFVQQSIDYNRTLVSGLNSVNVPAFNQPISQLPDSDYDQLRELKSYAQEDTRPSQGTAFPVIFFTPGASNQVQQYENIITNLVSHGYIVIAVNSIYLTGYIALPNGNVITQDFSSNPSPQADINSRTADIMYTYSQLPAINNTLSNILNVKKVGIMGHSDGAAAVVSIMSSTYKQNFSAAIAMDQPNNPEFLPSFDKPFLHELSGERYWAGWYGSLAERVTHVPKYMLVKNNYLAAIVPNLESLLNQPPVISTGLYSVHGSFSDWTTLQNTHAFQSMIPVNRLVFPVSFGGNTPGYPYGTGDGLEVNNAINTYNLQFFDTYLKDKPNPVFNNTGCKPLAPNTIISCGPTTFPYE